MGHFFAWKTLLGIVSGLILPTTFLLPHKSVEITPVVSQTTHPQVFATTTPPKVAIAIPALLPKKKFAVKQSPHKKIISTPGPLVIVSTSSAATNASGLVSDTIATLTNIERQKMGLPPLLLNKTLSLMAEEKGSDMIAKQYFAHVSPDGINLAAVAKKFGYNYLNVGENLALGDFHSSPDVVNGWMNSPGHRANILNTKYAEIGVGAVKGNWKGKEVWFAVQEFGRPSSACPSPDPLLEEKIAVYKSEIATLEVTLKNLKAEIASSTGDQTALLSKTNDYSAVVATYNTIVATTKTNIANYNAEAEAFNECAGF